MTINPAVKKNWIELQKKFDVPVNAIGARIANSDEKTLRVWKEEGIDKFMSR